MTRLLKSQEKVKTKTNTNIILAVHPVSITGSISESYEINLNIQDAFMKTKAGPRNEPK